MHEQTLQLNSDFYTPNTDECIPYGAILPVENTPFDFRTAKKIGKDIVSDDEQITKFGGFDHNFVLRGRGFRKGGEMASSDGKIIMEFIQICLVFNFIPAMF